MDQIHILKIVLIAAQVCVLLRLPGIWGEGEDDRVFLFSFEKY